MACRNKPCMGKWNLYTQECVICSCFVCNNSCSNGRLRLLPKLTFLKPPYRLHNFTISAPPAIRDHRGVFSTAFVLEQESLFGMPALYTSAMLDSVDFPAVVM